MPDNVETSFISRCVRYTKDVIVWLYFVITGLSLIGVVAMLEFSLLTKLYRLLFGGP